MNLVKIGGDKKCMYKVRLIFILIVNIFVVGCSDMFLPPPFPHKKWERKNTTTVQTEEVMMDCGYPDIFGEGSQTEKNDIALMHLCMEDNGFKYVVGKRYCDRYANLPACIAAAEEKAAQKHNGNPSIR